MQYDPYEINTCVIFDGDVRQISFGLSSGFEMFLFRQLGVPWTDNRFLPI